uniref:Uncharacterized protein n=1 Tax=Pyrodinium bahamense TaxID=73915 RepID=A0A7S0A7U8_9DINO
MEAAKRLQPQQRRGAEPEALQAVKPLQSQQPGRAERPAFKKDSWKVASEKAGRRHPGGNDCEVLSNQSTKAPSSPMRSESAGRPALEDSRKVAPLEKAGHRHSGDKDCEALSNRPTKVPISPVSVRTSELPAPEDGSQKLEPDTARRPSMNSAYELLSSRSMASSDSRTRFRVCHVGSCRKADRCHSSGKHCEALSNQSTKVAMSSVIAGRWNDRPSTRTVAALPRTRATSYFPTLPQRRSRPRAASECARWARAARTRARRKMPGVEPHLSRVSPLPSCP